MLYARKFLTNYSFLVAGELAAKLLNFVALARMARVLGNDLFGDLAFAAAFISYFVLLVSQGLDAYGIREIARDQSLVRSYAGNILSLRLVTSIAAGMAVGISVLSLNKPWNLKLLVLLYATTLIPAAASLQWVFQGTERMKFVAAASVITQLIFAGCVLALLRHPSQYLWIPIFQCAAEILSTSFLFLWYWKLFGPLHFAFSVPTWMSILRDSIPIGLTNALSMVLFNFDMVLLGLMKPSSDVGNYSAAYRILLFMAAFVTLYSQNLFPAVSRTRDAIRGLRAVSDASLKYSAFFTIPVAVGGTCLAQPMLEFVFGPHFSGGTPALKILVWILPAVAVRSIYRMILICYGFQNTSLKIHVIAASANIALNVTLIPSYSLIGAAVASLVAESILVPLSYIEVAKKVGRLPILEHLWKPVVACIPMILFLSWIPTSHLVVRVLGGFGVYMLAAWMVRAFTLRDIFRIWSTQPQPPA